jgi:hypothetical protein
MAGAPKHIGFLRIVLRRSVMGKTAPVTAERAPVSSSSSAGCARCRAKVRPLS